jgi:hypothetical protein
MRDLYATIAQVLPVIVLALIFDTRYFDRLGAEDDPAATVAEHKIWKLSVIRWYTPVVAFIILADTAFCLVVLTNLVTDATWTRWVAVAGAGVALGNLFGRIWIIVDRATRRP